MAEAVRYHRWIVGEMAPWLAGHVAELGAGSGNAAELLLDAGVERLTAIEPAARMFQRLRLRLARDPRATVLHGSLAGLAPGLQESFDTMVYLNVLEHVDDDREELRRAHACLRPGGHLCVFVPALPWLYGRMDADVGHVRRYDRAGLRATVEDAGFRIVRLRYFDAPGVLAWLLYVRLLHRELTPPTVAFYDRWVVPLTRAIERHAAPPIGKNLLCIAVKS